MSRFDAIRAQPKPARAAAPDAPDERAQGRAAARSGKKAISGYFSPEMSRALQILALEQDKSLQAMMGEAFDDILRKYGKHPFGER